MRLDIKKIAGVFFQNRLGATMPTEKKTKKTFSPCSTCSSRQKCIGSGRCAEKSRGTKRPFIDVWIPKVVDRFVLAVIFNTRHLSAGPY